jgi:hypothetical protein
MIHMKIYHEAPQNIRNESTYAYCYISHCLHCPYEIPIRSFYEPNNCQEARNSMRCKAYVPKTFHFSLPKIQMPPNIITTILHIFRLFLHFQSLYSVSHAILQSFIRIILQNLPHPSDFASPNASIPLLTPPQYIPPHNRPIPPIVPLRLPQNLEIYHFFISIQLFQRTDVNDHNFLSPSHSIADVNLPNPGFG